MDDSHVPQETLDPEDWDDMRQLGHQMVDDMLDYLRTVRERPVWQEPPAQVRARFTEPLPREPQGAEAAYEQFKRDILPYPMGNIHPRFWGWVIGTGSPFAALAELLAATLNPNLGGGNHIANDVEQQVIDWFKALFGYPEDASGLLVSGGSMANLVGLTVARNARAGYDIRKEGVRGGMRVYCSVETHSSVRRAVEVLGMGSDALCLIPVKADYQIDITALETAIAADRAAGLTPLCVVGNAGTVSTGGMDDLEALAALCEREGAWFHVDGAFGGLAALSPDLRPLVKGIERADSIAFDLHKWLYIPYEAGCTLVRNAQAHYEAFTLTPPYLEHTQRGAAAGSVWFSDYGIQLSRGFKALKIWLSIKEHGFDKFGRMIRQNVEQARYLAALVDHEPELERLAPVTLNIVCFRYRRSGMSDEELDRFNRELLLRLQESGVAVPSYTILDGKYALRVSIVNQRSRRDDFELFVHETLRLAREIAAEAAAQST
jgi:glutamate/tyrosine decarboxylase-like PLP-dependent enzyme